jgi:hypothetical protein
MDSTAVRLNSPAYQAYRILHVAFVLAPIAAGVDKFLMLMVNWDKYLSPVVSRVTSLPAHRFMLGVGVIEVVAGLIVAAVPRIGAYIVALWLLGIIVNLLSIPGYYDIALRDFGLMLAALALGRLSEQYA